MNESPTAELRFEALVRCLTGRARCLEEQRRYSRLIGVLVNALPPEKVAEAYRIAHREAA